ncbi:hypothetical protein STVIR_3253 [Streptomyces viridochromogenes Tue57]|uniref:Uncharacterized protein n=1 Tax=Streptomyces viridochromogenes Tue57 TaxID=1160705 RepID=L8PIQ5_STRVR|nr:hypothetical protein STVIR_3253 [Streptomyces viridochromogenes Tue57]
MPLIHDVPDDWNPDHRCCLECGNSAPDVTLRAITHRATHQQALACTRHIADVAAVLESFAPASQIPDEQVSKPGAAPATSTVPGPSHRSRV